MKRIADLMINGLPVQAEYDEDFCQDLKALVSRFGQAAGPRPLVVLLAAPPGAGKSTLAAFMEQLGAQCTPPVRLQALGMDGFHYSGDRLKDMFFSRQGSWLPAISFKGAPETFDAARLERFLAELHSGCPRPWPAYSRQLHEPIQDALPVTGQVLVVEGNYLLLRDPAWCRLRSLADAAIFVDADLCDLEDRLIRRKMLGGLTWQQAEAHVRRSDLYNARLVLEHSARADYVIRFSRGHWRLCPDPGKDDMKKKEEDAR